MNSGAIATIIIPAHNEARVIARTLRTLTADAKPGEFDIIVVCNGCSNDTPAVAANVAHPDVRVLAIGESSKARAMSHGDLHAEAFPRLYLDADVELTASGARAMALALEQHQAAVATPVYRLDGCTSLARQYWTEWQRRNPRPRAGTGCFGLSRAARLSFDSFPELLGDDLWVASTFGPVVVGAAETQVRLARTLPAVFKRRVRIERGNRERPTDTAPQSQHSSREVTARVDHTPAHRRAVGLFVVIGVHSSAAVWGKARPAGGWAQDGTSRA